ncbi:MAG: hypothetical protein IPK74_30685 [Deltaproteobacteria bacterium]|nr:hypothetical protein [Deltaproteobacteria bacterium]
MLVPAGTAGLEEVRQRIGIGLGQHMRGAAIGIDMDIGRAADVDLVAVGQAHEARCLTEHSRAAS